jgi:Putative zinc-finger
MKARILPLDSDEHRLAQELLPWFVNATLESEEAAQVQAHLLHCVRCQADAVAQAALRAVPVVPTAGSSVERDWAALRERLGAPAQPRAAAAIGRRWWQRALPLAAAAQVLVVLGLTAVWVGSPRPEPYRALGAAPQVDAANAVAVFRSDATEREMRAALRAAGARIVGGPTLTDAYLLHLDSLDAHAIARLRAQPGVHSVESLQGEPAR